MNRKSIIVEVGSKADQRLLGEAVEAVKAILAPEFVVTVEDNPDLHLEPVITTTIVIAAVGAVTTEIVKQFCNLLRDKLKNKLAGKTKIKSDDYEDEIE